MIGVRYLICRGVKSDKIVAKLDDKILRNDNQLKIFLNKL